MKRKKILLFYKLDGHHLEHPTQRREEANVSYVKVAESKLTICIIRWKNYMFMIQSENIDS